MKVAKGAINAWKYWQSSAWNRLELNARLTDIRSAIGFHMRVSFLLFRHNIWQRNGWIPYLPWNQSLQISHSIINRLTSYGCRQTQYSWAVAIFGLSPNNAAKLESGWAEIPSNYAETTQRGTREEGRREHAVTSCINTEREARQVTSSLRNTKIGVIIKSIGWDKRVIDT